MTDYDPHSKEAIDAIIEAKAKIDNADFNAEMAGLGNGRPKRFMPREFKDKKLQDQRTRERLIMNALQALLHSNPEYAALYNETNDLLCRAEIATEKELFEAEQQLSEAQSALDETIDNANISENGEAVFKDKNGDYITADGRKLEGDELNSIRINKNAPSYEEYLKHKQAIEDIQYHIDALRRYQIDVLGKYRDRMDDEDNPPSKEELEGFQDDIKHKAPNTVKSYLDPEIEEKPPNNSGPIQVLDF